MSQGLSNLSNQLTICIPTYNRFSKLKKQVGSILTQLGPNDRIIVLDNCTPLEEWNPNDEIFNDRRITLKQNSSNVGANANVMKCMDIVEDGWLWILSDDDEILSDALLKIRAHLDQESVDYINFRSELAKGYVADRVCNNINEYLIEIGKDFGNHLLISNNLYRVSALKKFMKFSFLGCFTNTPHISPVIMALQNGGKLLLSEQQIVHWVPPADKTKSWRIISLFNIIYLADLLSTSNTRALMIKALIESVPKLEILTLELCNSILQLPQDKGRVLDYADRIFAIYIRHGKWSQRIKAMLLKRFIRFPGICYGLADLICKCVKKKKLIMLLQNKKFEFYL